jgi:iron(III) transport system permease protein
LWRNQRTLALGLATGVLVLAACAPLAKLFGELIREPAGLRLWAAAQSWRLFGGSLLLAAAVTSVALLLGVPLGVLFGRSDVVGRRSAWLVHAIPMFLPPFIPALGWVHLLGARSTWLFNAAGLVFVLGLTLSPIASSLVALGVMNVDASLEEVARTSARTFRVATRVLLPCAAHAIALAGLAVFALAFSEVGVPMFLRVDAFSAAVFARVGGVGYAPGEAFALAFPVLIAALGLVAAERSTLAARSYAAFGLRSSTLRPLELGRWRGPVTFGCWIAAAISAAPLSALAVRAASAGGVSAVLGWAGRAPANGVLAAAAAATVIVATGLVVGHAAARGDRVASWLDALVTLAFLTPACVLGAGLVSVWNRPATEVVYSTFAIIVLGFVARYAVLGVRIVASVVAQLPVELERAAAVSGAGYLRTLGRIVAPLGARGIALAWFVVLVFCLRDFETVALFYPPGLEPLSVRIFTLEANGPSSVVAALALLHTVITASLLALAGIWLRRTRT